MYFLKLHFFKFSKMLFALYKNYAKNIKKEQLTFNKINFLVTSNNSLDIYSEISK